MTYEYLCTINIEQKIYGAESVLVRPIIEFV